MSILLLITFLGIASVLLAGGVGVLLTGLLQTWREAWKHGRRRERNPAERHSRDQTWDDNIATINRLREKGLLEDREPARWGRGLVKTGTATIGVSAALTTMGIWMGLTGISSDVVGLDSYPDRVFLLTRAQFLIGLILILGFSIAAGGTRPWQHSSSWNGTATGLALAGLALLTPTLQLAMPANGIPVFCSLGLLVFPLSESMEKRTWR